MDQYIRFIGTDPGLVKEELVASDPYKPTAIETSRAFILERAKYLGISLMCRADLTQNRKLIEEFHNNFTKVNDNYPKDMTEAVFMLMNYKKDHIKQPAQISNDYEGLIFAQDCRRSPIKEI